ncbi:bifunctional folylpolyglutamate synthase/dihydrofolate synthase [Thermospira aquatica]|uniref:Mur ligase central domain-containing protein n=1 Tax=Thermospira aquatica TaxID=2828656 RepID=A0AAX3BEL8_9SPIR|nr:Mur ligase family protein [Thermospira aquatica]URA10570.1 hypothetical protein KDW03_01845 [Thermospira aquatica]
MHEFLQSLVNYEKGLLKYQMEHFDPQRVGEMLSSAGFSYDHVRIFHVAGTKGKGSTSTYLARILEGVFPKVGLYTSPHLFRVEERIRLNGEMIHPFELDALIGQWQDLIQEYECSFFEAMTFLAMVYFLRQGCEAVVLETGMGGRLDATNFVERPAACVITRIGYDHTKFLGDTLEKIAREKAGIIKPSTLVVSAEQEGEVRQVLEKTAHEQGAKLVYAGRGYELVEVSRERWVYRFPDGDLWETRQWGEVFGENFLVAMEVMKQLSFPVSREVMRKAFYDPIPFRMWYREPFVFDVAHNEDSFRALFATLEKIPGEKDLYLGILEEKDLERIASVIRKSRGLFQKVVCFDFASSRPSGGKRLAMLLGEGVEYCAQVPGVVNPERLVVVAGSFYWAEEFFRLHGLSHDEVWKS